MKPQYEALNHLFAQHLPELERSDSVPVGRFLLADAPDLALSIADEWAGLCGLPRYTNFLSRHNEADKPKPVKPSAEYLNDMMRRNPPVVAAHELPYYRMALEKKAMEKYFTHFREYEENQNNKELFARTYAPDALGYIKYLCSQKGCPVGFFFEEYKRLPISEEDRERHTYIVGGSGSGKTELVKHFLFHYIARYTKPALIIIEPHGELSSQVAKWRELADGRRLVYIQPGMNNDVTPVFNPFDISDEERNNPQALEVLVDDTIDIVAELLKQEFTPNMEVLMQACLTILYSRKGSSFDDVLRFVSLKNNKGLIEEAKVALQEQPHLLSFVLNDLHTDALKPTRQAVKMRFTRFLSNRSFSSFLIGKSTFRLDDLIRRRAVIVFNFASGDVGERQRKIFGKLILAHLKAFGFRQGRDKMAGKQIAHCHVFIDECQQFITDSMQTILDQLRKFGIHLTLVQQSIGQGMDKPLLDSVLTNTAVKITGRNSDENLHKFTKQTGAKPEDLEKLKDGKGRFCIDTSHGAPFVVRIPGNRLRDKGATKAEVWKATLSHQIACFYTKRKTPSERMAELAWIMEDAEYEEAKKTRGFSAKEPPALSATIPPPID